MSDGASDRMRARFRAVPSGGWVALSCTALLGALLAAMLQRGVYEPIDTWIVGVGADRALDCLGRGQLTDCGDVGPFPPAQYLLAAAFIGLGQPPEDMETPFALTNLAVLAGMLALAWRAMQREAGQILAALLVGCLLCGPLLHYAVASFGEPIAALTLLWLAVVCLRARTVWTVTLVALLATLTKETAAPFVVLLGASGLVLRRTSWSASKGRVAALVGGTVVGQFIHLALNIFRYGQATNEDYDGPLRVTDPVLAGKLFVSQVVAPNGALVWFWPAAVVVLIACALLVARCGDRAARLAMLGVIATSLGSVAALSFWFSPFGWFSWGPRLLLPVVPATLFLALCAAAPLIARLWPASLPRRAMTTGVTVLMLATSIPTLGVVADPQRVSAGFLRPSPACPRFVMAQVDSGAHYRCLFQWAWRERPLFVPDGIRGLDGSGITAALLLATAGCGAAFASAAVRPTCRSRS